MADDRSKVANMGSPPPTQNYLSAAQPNQEIPELPTYAQGAAPTSAVAPYVGPAPGKPTSRLKQVLANFFQGFALSTGVPQEAMQMEEMRQRMPQIQAQTEQAQQAAIGAQLQNILTQNRIKMMQGQGQQNIYDAPFVNFGTLTPDEQALKDAGTMEARMTGNPSAVFQAAAHIAGNRSITGRLGLQGKTTDIPVTNDMATRMGLPPEMVGRNISQNTLMQAQGKNIKVSDIGAERWLINTATGERLEKLGAAPGYVAGMARMNVLGPRMTSVMVNGVATPLPNAVIAAAAAGGKFFETAAQSPDLAASKSLAVAFSTGTESDQKQSFRAFIGHANDLADYSNEFSRTGSRWANIPLNELRKNAEDDPQIAAYLAKVEPVQKEFETFLLNNRALYESDRKTAGEILSGNMPPSQMQSALHSFVHTAAIRMGTLNQKYKDQRGTDDPTLLDPETSGILSKFGELKTVQKYQGAPSPKANGKSAPNGGSIVDQLVKKHGG